MDHMLKNDQASILSNIDSFANELLEDLRITLDDASYNDRHEIKNKIADRLEKKAQMVRQFRG